MRGFLSKVYRFFRAFWITTLALLCPIILIGGIILADRNTRQTAFRSAPPAISTESDDGQTEIAAFGYTLYIPEDTLDRIGYWAGRAKVLIPVPLRAGNPFTDAFFHGIKSILTE